jgi:ketosteroid isomerase-like protein
MSNEKSNKEILKTAYTKWHDTRGGSVDHWLSIMSDEIDFRSLADGDGGLNFTKRVESRADMERYFSGLSEGMEMINYKISQYVAQDDTVVAVGSTSWRVKETGKVFDMPKVDVVRFKDGKIVSFFEYYDTAKVIAAMSP